MRSARGDSFAWGDNVTTCGYGDLDAGTGDDSTYTDTFGGTSSASPIVAGAALIVQGAYEATAGTRIAPMQMRQILSNPATGTAQGPNVAGYISVMPNLRAILSDVLCLVPDVYVRDNVGDDGDVPSSGSISSSPDVITRPQAVMDPNAAFGEGSGLENATDLGYRVEAGQDNYIYVRMKNRGSSLAADVRAQVFWSEVATLVTPDLWNPIGVTAPVDVPTGDTLVVTDPLTWAAADIPATGHYCYVCILDAPTDPAPPLPPGPPLFDWNDFTAYIRANNNVTWRNFNVVDWLEDPSEPIVLPFLVTGAPDQKRVFDLNIVQRLPEGVEVMLEAPAPLAAAIGRNRLLPIERDERRLRLKLPFSRCLPLLRVVLPRAARYRCRFVLRVPRGLRLDGNGIEVRQAYEGELVGGVAWQFRARRREQG